MLCVAGLALLFFVCGLDHAATYFGKDARKAMPATTPALRPWHTPSMRALPRAHIRRHSCCLHAVLASPRFAQPNDGHVQADANGDHDDHGHCLHG
jgi:hypothetical protein